MHGGGGVTEASKSKLPSHYHWKISYLLAAGDCSRYKPGQRWTRPGYAYNMSTHKRDATHPHWLCTFWCAVACSLSSMAHAEWVLGLRGNLINIV